MMMGKKKKSRKKKNYNPFKMWGSYVGAVIYSIITFGFSIGGGSTDRGLGVIFKINLFVANLFIKESMEFATGVTIGFFSIILTSTVIGFLIGWGIHSLIRKLKK